MEVGQRLRAPGLAGRGRVFGAFCSSFPSAREARLTARRITTTSIMKVDILIPLKPPLNAMASVSLH
jgi:hypothetical protein